MKKPIKLRMLMLLAENSSMYESELFAILRLEYPKDRCLKLPLIQEYALSFAAIGFIRTGEARQLPDGTPEHRLHVTPEGMARARGHIH
jgi:hypothetical protein